MSSSPSSLDLNLSDGRDYLFESKIVLKFWKLGKVFSLFFQAFGEKKNLRKSIGVKVTDSKYANYEKHSFCSHIRSQTPTAIKWDFPIWEGWRFALPIDVFLSKVPCARAHKGCSTSYDSDAFVVCFWTFKKMQVMSDRHCLGVNIFVNEKAMKWTLAYL